MRILRLILLWPLLLITAHHAHGQTADVRDTGFSTCLQKASSLLDEAFSFMQKNYYRKNSIDWETLISTAKKRLYASGNCNDTYDIISDCFRDLNESHSFIMPPTRAAVYNNEAAALSPKPSVNDLVGEIKAELLDNGIAYLTVPWVSTTDSVICTMVADSLQAIIASFDQPSTMGWIVDLRKNTGGNCWPMLAGIGPLLGDGICGYFVSTREKIPISYKDGAASQGKHIRCRVSSNGYQMRPERKPIIVLTGRRTVSSGEIIALAFKGKEKVYLYGEPTAGYTTANATYTLSDNSMLVLTVCMEADRNGRICEGSIMPDETVTTATHPNTSDPAKSAAHMWLSAQISLQQ